MKELHPIFIDENPANGEIYVRHQNDGISLDTYFNMFDLYKWRQFTTVENIYLKIQATGTYKLEIYTLNATNTETLIHQETLSVPNEEERYIRIPEKTDTRFLFCRIKDSNQLSLKKLAWCTDTEPCHDVYLRCAICTFKKETYIYRNLRLLNQIRRNYPFIKKSLSAVIADNGNSLEQEKTAYDFVEVYDNINTGGAGGFARAMIEICQSSKPCTHVLIMDDDIEIAPTAIILSINLLAYLKEEYRCHFIGGAMMNLDQRNIKHASLEWFDKKHFWSSTGPVDVNNRLNVLKASIHSFHPDQYQAWWYCIIPTKVVNLNNLPLPLFFQNDDVEYALRNQAKIILMNGIAVWHEPFYKKVQNMKPYYSLRNALIVSATESLYPTDRILRVIRNSFRREICQFNYSGAQVYIDILEDFMQGPSILKSAEKCAEILKREISRNEKMIPFKEFGLTESSVHQRVFRTDRLHGLKRRIYDLTFNGHLLPSCLRKKEIEIIHCVGEQGPLCYMRKTVIAVDPLNQQGVIRKFDKAIGKRLIQSFERAYSNCFSKKEALLADYRNAHTEMTSILFYKNYLKII